MKRRTLLGGGLGALNVAAAQSGAQNVACEPCAPVFRQPALAADRKLRIKPVMTNILHTGVWEGPCRFNVVPVEKEKQQNADVWQKWVAGLKQGRPGFGGNADVLEPLHITFSESFTIPPDQMAQLEKDDADAFFIAPWGASFATVDIVKRFHKPALIQPLNCRTVDVAAYAATQGEEVFVANSDQELNRLTLLLRARQAYRGTRVLFPTDRGFPAVASLTGITDLADLEKRQGIAVRMISYAELADQMDRVLADAGEQKKADEAAGALMKQAQKSFIDRKYVARSLSFQHAVEDLMKLHGCNAFTVECFEFCSSRLPQKWNITPCLVHTLFKDRGIASSCEGDMGALLGTRLLLSVSGKSSHMGNMFVSKDNAVIVNHSAPGTRMNGFDQPPLPFQLGRFVESGWGTKAVVDFMNNTEKRATVARVHPNGRAVLVLRGQLVAAEGYDKDALGCSVVAHIKPVESGAGEKFARRQLEFGNHLSWVYGDYSEELRDLGRMMGMEVEVVS